MAGAAESRTAPAEPAQADRIIRAAAIEKPDMSGASCVPVHEALSMSPNRLQPVRPLLRANGPAIVRRIRCDDRNRSCGAAHVPRALPDPGEVAELVAVGHKHEVPRLPVLRQRCEPTRLKNLLQVLLVHRRGRELPHVAARPQRVPGLHTSPTANPRAFPTTILIVWDSRRSFLLFDPYTNPLGGAVASLGRPLAVDRFGAIQLRVYGYDLSRRLWPFMSRS